MAVEGLDRILRAQEKQRGGQEHSKSNDTDPMEILKLMFEYIKTSNKELKDLVDEIKNTQTEIISEIKELKRTDNE